MNAVDAVSPNRPVSHGVTTGLYAFWVLASLTVWVVGSGKIMPTPSDLVAALPVLWYSDGLAKELWTSVTMDMQAVGALTVVSLAIAYATVMPVGRPFARLFSLGRFNGFVGIPLIFTLLLGNPHYVKVALLVFGAGVFTVPSLVKVIESIPKEQYDLGRTLKMGEWRVVWEVVVLGTADQFLDVLATNCAMLWMLVPMVEVLFRYEGGVGAMMVDLNRHMNLAGVYALTLIVLAIGLGQDVLISRIKKIVCPYAQIGLER